MMKLYTILEKKFKLHISVKIFSVVFCFLLFFAGNIGKINAQGGTQIATLTWIQEPKQFPQDLIILGDTGYIYLHIVMVDDPANNLPWVQPRIKIDLPLGIDFSQANWNAGTTVSNILISESGLTPVARFTATTAPSGAALSGTRTITLAYIGGSGAPGPASTLALGDSIKVKVRIRALWEASVLNPGTVTVNMSSGTGATLLGGTTRTTQLNLMRPSLRIYPTPPFTETFIFNNILDTMLVSVDIDAQQGHTRTAFINYAYRGDVVHLDSFKLDGILLPVTTSATASVPGVYHANRFATNASVQIRLDQTLLKGNITATPRTLTFRATANRGCNWNLSPWIQNPLVPNISPSGTNSYDRWTSNATVLSLPGVRANPIFYSQRAALNQFNATNNPVIMRVSPRFDLSNPNNNNPALYTTPTDAYSANNFNSFCWDGETPNYTTLALKSGNNTLSGGVFTDMGQPTITFEFRTYLDYYTNLSYCEYYDTAQIYYRVWIPKDPKNLLVTDSLWVPITRLKNTDRDYYGRLCIDPTNNFPSSNAEIKAHYDPVLWDKSRRMTLRLPGIGMANPLPAGAIVEFQWVVYANPDWINESWRSRSQFETFHDSQNHLTHTWDAPRFESTCGDVYTGGGRAVLPSMLKPRFRARPLPKMAVYSQQTFYWSNPTNTGDYNSNAVNNPTNDPTGPRYAEYFVKLPPWLNLDFHTRIDDAFIIRHRDSVTFHTGNNSWRPTINSGVDYGEDANGYKTYSVKYHVSVDGVMDIRLKPGDCPEEIVIKDTLQVWIDWISGSFNKLSGDPNEECRKVFRKTSKVFTELEFICTPPALAIDTFGVFRITRGLRDSDNDHLPDDGSLALDEEIDHRHFLEGDTGYFFFKGYVGGTTSQRYDKLVVVLKYGTGGSIGATFQYKWGNTGHTIPLYDQGTIEIKRWNEEKTDFTLFTLPLSIPTITNQDSVNIFYDGGFNDYIPRGGDSCYLKVPFRCRMGSNNNIRGNFYCLTFGIRQNDPKQEWVSKYFPDALYRIVHRNHSIHANGGSTWTFPSPCIPQVVNDLYTRTFHGGDEISDWPREVRYRHKLEKVVLRIPGGFSRTDDKISLRMWRYYNVYVADAFDFKVVPDLAEEDFATQDSIFTIDMTKYIDYEYDGSQGYTYNTNTGLLSNGKFPPGDDVGGVYATFKSLYATPASNRNQLTGTNFYSNSLVQPQGTNTNSIAQTANIGTKTLNYTGRKLQMELLPQTYIMFNQYAFTSLKLTNANAGLINENTWLFVKGNVYDAYLVNQATKDTIWGEGLNNCWLNVGTMLGSEIQNHNLVYSYKGKNECSNDTVTVYSAFNASDVPTFSIDKQLGIEQVDKCNRGERKYTILDLMTARIKVAGYIEENIPNPAKPGFFHYNQGYAMDYVINGKVSQGALNDASVTFRIPVGQVYVDTTT
ncbi:MAG: hypothetical protein LBI45_07705, partial [Bacteroidales bacterium]|nr:hypothetical protein [Bacteroidales bacterium]